KPEPIESPIPARLPSPVPPPRDLAPMGSHRTLVWTLGGVSAAMLVGGIVVALHADAAYDDYRRTTSPREYDSLRQQISTEDALTTGLLIAGGGAAAAAAIVYLLDRRGAPASSDHVRPTFARSGANLLVVGEF